ncbi:ras-related and estrogen-regulated growth inhibitor-like [Pocillopora damicornis]|uniref:ras-related and estrogen-regulated growth inhibitor-like n=1 Tax=Pocillopora damicornis TaxID=46731 RepID=UPI000F5584BA|nr:ras-related and estrogen-regulated growth inhibitor-like [Pocillopora damicornis]
MGQRKIGTPSSSLEKINVVVMGKDDVGKSAMTVRLLTKRFIGEYDSSLESIYRHYFKLEENFIALDIMDTAGKNTEEKLSQCSSFGNMFLLLFSITDRSSLKEIHRLGHYLKTTKTSGAYSISVVGTKRDLSEYRKVSEDEGRTLANELGGTYHEISSAEGYEETLKLFQDAIKVHLQSRYTDRDRQKRGLGLRKLREGLLMRTKSLYRKRGLTF